MDIGSLVTAMLGAQMGRFQLAVAAQLMRTNANHDADIAKLIDSAQGGTNSLANVAAGLGTQVDISV